MSLAHATCTKEDWKSLEQSQRDGESIGDKSLETAKWSKVIHPMTSEGQFNEERQVIKRLFHNGLILSDLKEKGECLDSEFERGSYYILGLLLSTRTG